LSLTDSNTSDEWGASNTANLRGSILRIHPDSSQKGYSIPKGNFGEYWADIFEAEGKMELAEQYRDPVTVRPEIYSKGHRSNFSVTVDPKTGWVTSGEVGPWNTFRARDKDSVVLSEEFNLLKSPQFTGWPYFVGPNSLSDGHDKDPLAPENTSPLSSGAKFLPPAFPGTYNYGTVRGSGITAITGPIYRYNPSLKSAVKMPPHFDGKWFVAEYMQNWVKAFTLDEKGDEVIDETRMFENYRFYDPLDFHAGPDGAFYILNAAGRYTTTINTGIVRLEYHGDCRPGPTAIKERKQQHKHIQVFLGGHHLQISEGSHHTLKLFDVAGGHLLEQHGQGSQYYNLFSLLGTDREPGLYILQVHTQNGVFTGKVFFP
jgi:cytochrome c